MKQPNWLCAALVFVSFALGAALTHAQSPADKCAALAKLTLPQTTIDSAHTIPAGALPQQEPFSKKPAQSEKYKQLPAFCRVQATLRPSSDSDIKIEVWLPVDHWNGKFRGQGNGGFAGEIDLDHLAWSIMQGYATGGTDTGHTGNGTDATWALHHPEKIADYGHRALHEMTVKSKAIAAAYYGAPATHSYFASCSDGGREALMEAQRYPADYDGILAGAPANNWTHLLSNAAHNAQIFASNPDAYIPPAKIPTIASAVLAACDKLDGLTDGILDDPRQCRFDPSSLLCKEGNSDSCLTAPQVDALKQLYAGAHSSAGQLVFPGYLPGSELGPNGWTSWITGPVPGQSLMTFFGAHYFADMVYSNADWDLKSFNLDEGLSRAMATTSQALDSTNPDLRPFIHRGGKLILYHGWNDPAISATSTIDYYRSVLATTGKSQTESAVRLYMVPGVQHCFLGPGPDVFGQFGWSPETPLNDPQHDMYSALEQWVEHNQAPSTILAVKYEGEDSSRHVTMTRPLCPYPQVAKYNGSGDPNSAASFACANPKP
ncbi:MAG TPA: tannase/feruloyl esterase family alpha/beta hydrolase [Acidobacteriaceae bacterium]